MFKAAFSPAPPCTDARTRSIAELESEVVGLAGHLAAAHCYWLQLLAEFDDRDGWAGPGLRTCAHWLSWRVGMNLRTGFEQLRVAHALTGLPATTAAFAAGRISYSKVRAITRVATAETEQPLVDLALAGTASHVERVVRAARQARADPAETHVSRRLTWSWDDDGTLDLRGRFTPEQGAFLLHALAAQTDHPSAGRSYCSAEHSSPPGQRSADAPPVPIGADGSWVESDTAAVGTAPDAPDEAPLEPLDARRADALIALIARPGEVGSAFGNSAQVVLHIDADRATAEIENGPSIPPASAERIACSARVRALVKDRRGNPLYLGRTHRLVTKKLFAAVSIRDQHRCRWAGCTETRHLDAHHVKHWLHGGRTDIHNLVLLCDRHHRLIHDHGYSMRGSGTDVTFHRPNGQRIPDAGPPTEGRPEGIYDVSAARGVTVTDEALTPTWAGERLDPTPILALLLPERPLIRAA
jgi:hypothetical protein